MQWGKLFSCWYSLNLLVLRNQLVLYLSILTWAWCHSLLAISDLDFDFVLLSLILALSLMFQLQWAEWDLWLPLWLARLAMVATYLAPQPVGATGTRSPRNFWLISLHISGGRFCNVQIVQTLTNCILLLHIQGLCGKWGQIVNMGWTIRLYM